MDGSDTWQWRGWRGRRVVTKDNGPMRHAQATPPTSTVPPAPPPVSAVAPEPRVVWEDAGGSAHAVRLIATDWADRDLTTYQVQAAHGSSWWAPGDGTLWVAATGEDWMRMFMALAAAIDERTPRSGRDGV